VLAALPRYGVDRPAPDHFKGLDATATAKMLQRGASGLPPTRSNTGRMRIGSKPIRGESIAECNLA
jgi:hypothetical protein